MDDARRDDSGRADARSDDELKDDVNIAEFAAMMTIAVPSLKPPRNGLPVETMEQLTEIVATLPATDVTWEESHVTGGLILRRPKPSKVEATDTIYDIACYKYPLSWRNPFAKCREGMKLIDKKLGKEDPESITPPRELVFAAFELTPLPAVKVVIIGKDPYPNGGAAMGLSFSCPKWIDIQASLKNIYTELEADYPADCETPFHRPDHGDLTEWARKGVLLLNSALTNIIGSRGAHSDGRWDEFIDAVISEIVRNRTNVVFMMWGADAQAFSSRIPARHCKLTASHPSPLSYTKGRVPFKGCGHFRAANDYLVANKQTPIDW